MHERDGFARPQKRREPLEVDGVRSPRGRQTSWLANPDPPSAACPTKTPTHTPGLTPAGRAHAPPPPTNHAALPDAAAITPKKSTPASGSFDFIHLFVKTNAELARDLPKLEPRLAQGG